VGPAFPGLVGLIREYIINGRLSYLLLNKYSTSVDSSLVVYPAGNLLVQEPDGLAAMEEEVLGKIYAPPICSV
jgi:hypothetical protein